jgi:hypothetical protein
MIEKKLTVVGFVATTWLGGAGCVVQQEPDASKFIQAIPTADDVKLKEPTGPQTTPQSLELDLSIQGNPPAGYATYYRFTREIFDGVNLGTGYILGSVWLIVHYPPSTLSDREAVWGPWTEALSPAEYRFRATEVATDEYEYALEARAKESNDDYVQILIGHGYGEGHAKHREGTFTIDFDKANQVDPTRLHADDESGSLTVDYLLSSFPTTIDVTAADQANGSSFHVKVVTEQSGGGRVRVESHDDLDDSKQTAKEDITMNSRWVTSGAGRADVTVRNGDLPGGTEIKASECWSSSFERTYWTDSAGIEPAQGDVAECPYADAEY